jgi:type I restriction enzyme, S subunit
MNTIVKKGWKKVMFGEVCSNLNVATQDPNAMGIDRYVGLEHLETGNLRITSWGNVADGTTFKKTFKPGHVLFGKRRAYLKKAAVADFKGLCSSDILVFEADEKVIEKRLLPFLISSDRFFEYAVQTSAGSLSPRTKFQDLAKFEFLLPPKNQQAKLAELLWAADELVERYVQLGTNLAKFRDTLVETVMQSTKNYVTLDTTGIISYGMGVPPKYNEKGVAIIRATNINGGEITEKDMLKALPEDISPGKRVFLNEGDIIVVRSGAYTGDVGYISMEWANTLAGYDLVYKPDRNKVNPIFIRDILLSTKIQSYFKSESTRSAQPHLNAEQLRATLIPAMDMKSQNAISEKINNLTLKYKETALQIEKSNQIQKQLINRIFSA